MHMQLCTYTNEVGDNFQHNYTKCISKLTINVNYILKYKIYNKNVLKYTCIYINITDFGD